MQPPLSPPMALLAPPLIRRMACWMYEGVLLFGVGFLASAVIGWITQNQHASENSVLWQLLVFAAFGLYFVWFWSKGQTLAMKTWHIRVTDASGQAVRPLRAVLRYILSWMWFLPLVLSPTLHLPLKWVGLLCSVWVVLWAVLSRFQPEKQFWHDVLAGTRLVTFKHEQR